MNRMMIIYCEYYVFYQFLPKNPCNFKCVLIHNAWYAAIFSILSERGVERLNRKCLISLQFRCNGDCLEVWIWTASFKWKVWNESHFLEKKNQVWSMRYDFFLWFSVQHYKSLFREYCVSIMLGCSTLLWS